MAKFVMKNATVTINGTDLGDHVAEFSVETRQPEVDTSALGTGWRTFVSGLKEGSVTLSLHNDFAASSVSLTINPLLGSYATVVASGTFGGAATSGTAVCYVNTVTPIGGAIGDLSVQNVTWPTSGTVTGWGL
jgi:hypothetical protein